MRKFTPAVAPLIAIALLFSIQSEPSIAQTEKFAGRFLYGCRVFPNNQFHQLPLFTIPAGSMSPGDLERQVREGIEARGYRMGDAYSGHDGITCEDLTNGALAEKWVRELAGAKTPVFDYVPNFAQRYDGSAVASARRESKAPTAGVPKAARAEIDAALSDAELRAQRHAEVEARNAAAQKKYERDLAAQRAQVAKYNAELKRVAAVKAAQAAQARAVQEDYARRTAAHQAEVQRARQAQADYDARFGAGANGSITMEDAQATYRAEMARQAQAAEEYNRIMKQRNDEEIARRRALAAAQEREAAAAQAGKKPPKPGCDGPYISCE